MSASDTPRTDALWDLWSPCPHEPSDPDICDWATIATNAWEVARESHLELEEKLCAAKSKLNLIRIEAEERDKNNGDISPAWILQTLEE